MRQLRLGEGSFAQQSGNMTLSEVSPLSSGRCAAGVDEKSRMTFRDFAQNRGTTYIETQQAVMGTSGRVGQPLQVFTAQLNIPRVGDHHRKKELCMLTAS
jgi:hypothetical protein